MCITPQWAACKGGIGNVTKAMAKAAERSGATIKMGVEVKKILVKDGKAVGVKLSTGEEISASVIVSNAEVGQTMLGMVGVEHLEAGFVKKVKKMWHDPTGVTLNLALSELPEFKFPKDRLKGLFGITPSYDYMEKAFYEYNIREIPEKRCLLGWLITRTRSATLTTCHTKRVPRPWMRRCPTPSPLAGTTPCLSSGAIASDFESETTCALGSQPGITYIDT